MGEPIVIDSSIAGLDQSNYYPFTRRSQYPLPPQLLASEPPTSSQGGTSDLVSTIIQSIIACIIPGKTDEVLYLF
jgi:hypothetical protein